MPLNRSEPDAAEAEDGHRVTRLNLGRVVNSADAGGHTATQQADMLGIGVRLILASETSATTVYSLKVEQPM